MYSSIFNYDWHAIFLYIKPRILLYNILDKTDKYCDLAKTIINNFLFVVVVVVFFTDFIALTKK